MFPKGASGLMGFQTIASGLLDLRRSKSVEFSTVWRQYCLPRARTALAHCAYWDMYIFVLVESYTYQPQPQTPNEFAYQLKPIILSSSPPAFRLSSLMTSPRCFVDLAGSRG